MPSGAIIWHYQSIAENIRFIGKRSRCGSDSGMPHPKLADTAPSKSPLPYGRATERREAHQVGSQRVSKGCSGQGWPG